MDIKNKISRFFSRVHKRLSKSESDKIKKISGEVSNREKIHTLFDKNSFFEINKSNLSQVISGFGNINHKQISLFFEDNSKDMSEKNNNFELHDYFEKLNKIINISINSVIPFLSFNNYCYEFSNNEIFLKFNKIFKQHSKLKTLVPHISVITSKCVENHCSISDFVISLKNSNSTIDKKNIYCDDNVDFNCEDDSEINMTIKKLLSFIPSNSLEKAETLPTENPKKEYNISNILPKDNNEVYNIKNIILSVFDNSEFLEIKKHTSKNIVIGFSRLNGNTVGILCNQLDSNDKIFDINTVNKILKFITFCNNFYIPIITFVDSDKNSTENIDKCNSFNNFYSNLIKTWTEITVQNFTLYLRRVSGKAFTLMNNNKLGADISMCLDETVFTQEINDYTEEIDSKTALSKGIVDSVIEIKNTRDTLIDLLNLYQDK